MKKLIKAVLGVFLYLAYTKRFDPKILAGERIALVGPADSALGTQLGRYIDNFDYVIRINKAPLLISARNHTEDIGTKTDILFHSFLENEKTGGGRLDFKLYRKLGIRYVINPIPTGFGKRQTFNFYKKYLAKRTTYIGQKDLYKKIIHHFGKYRPTTGFGALLYLLNADFSELYITGFTFFKTSYSSGYRDHLLNMKSNEKHIKAEAIHNPKIEYEQFKTLLNANRQKNIQVDEVLKSILEKDGLNIPSIDSLHAKKNI